MNKQNATQSEQVVVLQVKTIRIYLVLSHLSVAIMSQMSVEKVKFYKNKLTQGFL